MLETRLPRASRRIYASTTALVLLIVGSDAVHAAELPGALRLAYIDPGTGSLILQAVLAALAAVAVATRAYWDRIRGWLGRSSPKLAEDGDLLPDARAETPRDDD